MMYMLDTDVISYLIRGASEKLRSKFMEQEPGNCILCSVVCAELEYGLKKKGSAEISARVHKFLEQMPMVDFDRACAEKYAEIRCTLEKKGTVIGNADMMIAASSLAVGAVFVTNNTRHFSRVKGLRTENWCL
jgi:tRNA(fMet)-specific endonuclease VapC